MRIKIASYNIRKAIGRDARRDPARILSVIAELCADIVALQEADYRFNGRRALFDPAVIKTRTGLRPLPLDHGEAGLGWHGNVVLLADHVDVVAARPLTLKGFEPRGAVHADLSVAGARLRVVGTHLGLVPRNRLRQARAVLEAARPEQHRPTVIVGDFNGWGAVPRSLRPFETALSRAPTGPSYPSRRPFTPLDRIYFGPGATLHACGVSGGRVARTASDHLPIWAEFELAEPSLTEPGPAEPSSTEAKPAEASPAEPGPAEPRPAGLNSTGSGPDSSDPVVLGPPEADTPLSTEARADARGGS